MNRVLFYLAFCASCLGAGVFGQEAAFHGEISQWIEAAAAYQSGQSMQPLRQIEELVRQAATRPELKKEIEAGLVKLLDAPSTLEAKQFAAQQLQTIGTEDSLPALAGLLRAEETVSIGCQALSTHPAPAATEVLRQAAAELRGAPRVQVIGTLGARQDPASVQLLANLASNPDRDVATAAILALGKMGNEPARAAIAALRKNGPPATNRAVLEASLMMAEQLASRGEARPAAAIYEGLIAPEQPVNVRRGAFEALLHLDDDLGEQRILQTLRGQDPVLTPVAIAAIRRLRSQSASEKFAAALPSLRPQEQVWLIEILAARRDQASRAALEASLSALDATVRLAAIQGMSRSADPGAVGLLAKALAAARESRERAAIERALTGLQGGEDVDAAVVDELNGAPASSQSSLIRVLSRRESRAAIPTLLEFAERADTAELAFQALGALATFDELSILLDKLVNLRVPAARSDAEDAVARALYRTDDRARRAEAVRRELANAVDIETRCSLLRLLPACAHEQALAALEPALIDSNPRVRDTAVRALADWPDVTAWELLVDTLRQTESQLHRSLALNALARLADSENARPNERLIGRYRQLLAEARTDTERKLILGALAGAAHPEAVELVRPLLADPGVRAEAEMALQRIAGGLKETGSGPALEP